MESALKERKNDTQRLMAGRRMRVSIPITISGKDKNGQAFREEAQTILATRRGVLVGTSHKVTLGAELTIENPALGRTSLGRVIWADSESSLTRAKEVGVYLPDVEEVCGIQFPADGGQRISAFEPVDSGTELEPSPSGTPVSPTAENYPVFGPAVGQTPPHTHRGRQEPQEQGSAAGTGALKPIGGDGVEQQFNNLLPRAETNPAASEPLVVPTSTAPAFPAERINTAFEAALAQFEARIGETAPVHLKRTEEKLAQLASQIASRTCSSLQESAARLAESTMGSLEQQLGSLGGRLQSSRAEAEAILAQLKEVQQQSHASLQESASRLEQSLAEALEQRADLLGDRLQETRREVQAMAAKLEEIQDTTESEVAKTQQVIGELSSQAIEFAIEGASQQFQAEMESLASSIARKASEQIRRESDTLVEAFIEGQCRDRLQARLTEFQERSGRELESHLEKVLTEHSEIIFNRLHKEFEGFSERALAQVQGNCQQALQAASDGLDQRVSAAMALLNECSRQTVERLDAHARKIETMTAASVENLETQLGAISTSAVEKLEQNCKRLLEDFFDRFQQNADVLESAAVDAVRMNAQKLAESVTEDSAAQLRQFSEDNLELVKEQVAESQNQMMKDSAEALRKAACDLIETSAPQWRKLADENLNYVNEALVAKKSLFIHDTEQAFRNKIGEILTLLQDSVTKEVRS